MARPAARAPMTTAPTRTRHRAARNPAVVAADPAMAREGPCGPQKYQGLRRSWARIVAVDISPAPPFLDGAAVTNPSGWRARDTGLTIAGVGGVLSRSSVLEGRNPMDLPVSHSNEIDRGDSLDLNSSGARFLSGLDDGRIDEACKSLRRMLGMQTLAKRTFLDVGSGSGLFSLAAMRLGAARVVSFDHDPHSVACGVELKRRYFPARGQLDHRAGQRARRSTTWSVSGRSTSSIRAGSSTRRASCGTRWPTWPSRSPRAAGCSSPSTAIRAGCRGCG